ncbi:SRPBCC family protein [Chitinophaga barathri]|uniref:ATPase n=1 Tax=Chitinophaga barathri TaxID=1647451 RepID=A0A3N4MIM5_9BACT|nr:SRPBCC family protein [Chitinophaga barathri]RPD43305.1 ATPase [Chitinophaga barathri]
MKTKNQTKVTAEPGKQELFVIREFEAPRELVFKAFTDPAIVSQFLGPHNLEMKIDHYNMKTGGSYRYIHADGSGNEYAFNGAVHEVTFPERMIQTFEFEGLPEKGHVSLDTSIFEALPGNRTKLIIQSVFRSVADRDGMVQAGMEQGLSEGFERLDDYLEKNS